MLKNLLMSPITRNLVIAISTMVVAFFAKRGLELNKEFVEGIMYLGMAAIGGGAVSDYAKANVNAAIVSSPSVATEDATAKIAGQVK